MSVRGGWGGGEPSLYKNIAKYLQIILQAKTFLPELGLSHYLTLVRWQGSGTDCSSMTDAGLFGSDEKFGAAPFLKWFDKDIFGSNQLIVVPEAKESVR